MIAKDRLLRVALAGASAVRAASFAAAASNPPVARFVKTPGVIEEAGGARTVCSGIQLTPKGNFTGQTSRVIIFGGVFSGFLKRLEVPTQIRAFSAAADNFPFSGELGGSPRAKDRAVVHISLRGNKCSVTMTDSKGNKRAGASTGSLEERKGRGRASRLAAEATAEQVGRMARRMGIKSVIMKVKGTTLFRKKKKVILSFKEGFAGDDVGIRSPIVQIHDVTQLPHNGCRLPKRRRV